MGTGTKKYVCVRTNEKDQIIVCGQEEGALGVEIPDTFHGHLENEDFKQLVKLTVHDCRHGHRSNCHKDLKKDLLAMSPHDYAMLMKHCGQVAAKLPPPDKGTRKREITGTTHVRSKEKSKRPWR